MATTENSFFYWAQAPAPTALPPSMLRPPEGCCDVHPSPLRSQPPPFFVFFVGYQSTKFCCSSSGQLHLHRHHLKFAAILFYPPAVVVSARMLGAQPPQRTPPPPRRPIPRDPASPGTRRRGGGHVVGRMAPAPHRPALDPPRGGGLPGASTASPCGTSRRPTPTPTPCPPLAPHLPEVRVAGVALLWPTHGLVQGFKGWRARNVPNR